MNKILSFLKAHNIIAFIALCAFVLATIGGTSYLFYDGHRGFGICNILLAILALPSAFFAIDTLTGNDHFD